LFKLLSIFAAFVLLGGFNSAWAGQSAFRLKSGQELLLKIDKQRKITGEVRTKGNAIAALIEGTNTLPGHIQLQFKSQADPSVNGVFVYEYRPCGHSTISLYKNPDCAAATWVSQQAPSHLAKLDYCFDQCKIFNADTDPEPFDQFVNWSTTWDSYVGSLSFSGTKSKRASLIKCLQEKGINSHFDGDNDVAVPPGLENLAQATISKCGLGQTSMSVTEKGSSSIPLTFLAGTFFTGPLSLANIADKVASVRSSLQQGLTAEGLETDVKQASIGGMDFIITLTGHSDRFPFPAGNWFKTEVELKLTERSEPQVPQGKVQQGELHVIGTEIFHGPSTVRPAQNQFQAIARVDRTLNDGPVDSILAIELANRLASRYHGAIVTTPEGF
jgi:hypothetical protein